jgi:hypothetical protein
MVAIAHSIALASMPANHYRSGVRKDGFTPTIRAVGSSGIVGTTWAADCRRKTFDRSGGGRQCDDIFGRSNFTASQATRPAANANDRLFYTGPTTAENFDPYHTAIAIFARAIFRKSMWRENLKPQIAAHSLSSQTLRLVELPIIWFAMKPKFITSDTLLHGNIVNRLVERNDRHLAHA